ncbi:MAG: hypothetical protein ACRCZF_21515 [Gemmataceae bacterium]
MTPAEALQLRKLAALIAPHIPTGFPDWAAVAAWLWLSPDGKGAGGGAQAYDAAGRATGFTFPIPPLLGPLAILREMAPETAPRPWKTVLLQFGRRPGELRMIPEYDDALRWTVTEANYETRIPEQRPDFAPPTNGHVQDDDADFWLDLK